MKYLNNILLLIIIICSLNSCIREGFETTSVKYDLGTLDNVNIEFYKTFIDTNDVRTVDLKWFAELDAENPLFEYSESGFSSVSIAQLLRVDSVVVTFNGDRKTVYLDAPINNSFLREFYYIRSGNTFTKTFTNEDYENADPI
jgi:hypothetical protein